MLPALLVSLAIWCAPVPLNPSPGDDDGRELSVEEELLRTLRENGVITDTQFSDLTKLATRLRKERSTTRAELDAEVSKLADMLQERAASAPAGKQAPDAVLVSFKEGFRFKTADGKFELHPWFVFRERFTFVDADDKTPGLNGEDTGSFEARTARLWFDGFIGTEDLRYLIMFDVASAGAGILRDAYLDYRFAPEFHIRAGQMKRPVDREGFMYAPRTGLVDKAAPVVFFQRAPASDFEPGVMAWGELSAAEFEYYFGVFNGDGANNGPSPTTIGTAGGPFLPANSNNNDSSGVEVVARLGWNALGGPFGYSEGDYELSTEPKLAFGTHYSFNPERNPFPPAGVGQAHISTMGADVAFRYQGFFALAEVFARHIDRRPSNAPAPDTLDTGYFVQAQYFFGSEPKTGFELLGRWAQLDLDTTAAPAPFAVDSLVNDATLGLNYLFNGHRLKLQSALTYRDRDRRQTTGSYETIFQLQLQAIF